MFIPKGSMVIANLKCVCYSWLISKKGIFSCSLNVGAWEWTRMFIPTLIFSILIGSFPSQLGMVNLIQTSSLGLVAGEYTAPNMSYGTLYTEHGECRICPGRYFADRGIWILISGILATFDILPPKDKFGNEYLPELKFTNSITWWVMDSWMSMDSKTDESARSHAGEFECRFVPRSSKAKELIESL